ncbi:conserved domain protein : DNA gyrase inhibitor YacG OS=Cystobacter fuscus DSM 2262 GN=yacG PE=3 SV=1: DUF329 [Gemmata massiliana]|uniref:DNA gyrase inhibitor YacG n=1 Tax=Gemmata massiliana TaxID=1210884 RepID=A0A6P2CVR6_9BACT|nr:DNA gyrase inhibitor YacG [Gemmata massiliana]VTR92697.1 conserved domain protein : DNA gyrase inhibitor YacG OS=Cystobacter fuscus DSM 2262 GN=yacG PE=3 SV=1: DUF329 [Gemmata massiliana]
MNKVQCSICDAVMPGSWQEYPDYPFCSSRCRKIDLGRWLDGKYRVPDPTPPDDASSSAPDDAD